MHWLIRKMTDGLLKAKKRSLSQEIQRRKNVMNGIRRSLVKVTKNIKFDAGLMTSQKIRQYIIAVGKLQEDLGREVTKLSNLRRGIDLAYGPPTGSMSMESKKGRLFIKVHDLMKLANMYLISSVNLKNGLEDLLEIN